MFKQLTGLLFCASVFAGYDQIDTIASQFTREFTIFDIGAENGDVSFALADKHPLARCIMVEDNNPEALSYADKLLEKCSSSLYSNIPLLLNKRLCNTDFKLLSTSNYFDVVLLLGDTFYTSKHSSWALKTYCALLLDLGWHTFIECNEESSMGEILLASAPANVTPLENGNSIFYFEKEKSTLSKLHIFSTCKKREIRVDYDNNVSIIETHPPLKYRFLQRPAGMSIVDFKGLYGSFPTTEALLYKKYYFTLNKEQSMHFHDIYITCTGFKLSPTYLPIENQNPITDKLFSELIKATTKKKILSLLKGEY